MLGEKGKALLAVVIAAAALAITGCGGDKRKGVDPAKADSKIIRVGAETTYPPFEFTEGDKYVGFDIDLADAVVKEIDGKMGFKSMGFDALIPALQSGQIDMIASSMNVTPERGSQVAFSEIYFKHAGNVVLVLKDNDQIHDWKDLAGKVVGVKTGTKQAELAHEAKASQVKPFESSLEAFPKLSEKIVDAVIIEAPVGMYYLQQGADKDMKIVGAPQESAGFAFAVKKDNKQLRNDVNNALKRLKANGIYDKIYEKWFGASGK